jgi:hypothetical protein
MELRESFLARSFPTAACAEKTPCAGIITEIIGPTAEVVVREFNRRHSGIRNLVNLSSRPKLVSSGFATYSLFQFDSA